MTIIAVLAVLSLVSLAQCAVDVRRGGRCALGGPPRSSDTVQLP